MIQTWAPLYFNVEAGDMEEVLRGIVKGLLQAKVLQLLTTASTSKVPGDFRTSFGDFLENLRFELDCWGLKVRKDLELSFAQVRELLHIQVSAILDKPAQSIDEKQAALHKATDTLELDAKEAADELASMLRARAAGSLVNAIGDLLQGREQQALVGVEELVKLAEFAATCEGMSLRQDWQVSVSMRKKLLAHYIDAKSPEANTIARLEDLMGVVV